MARRAAASGRRSTPGSTALERALDGADDRGPSPLDAFRLARRAWFRDSDIDMAALAQELGTSRATLYRWVGNKERLLAEVLWSVTAAAFEAAKRDAGRRRGVNYVATVVDRFLRRAHGEPTLRRFVSRDPEYALRILTSGNGGVAPRLRQAVQELLEAEIAAARIESPLDPSTLAYVLVRIGESFVYSSVIAGTETDPSQTTEVIRLLLRNAKR